MVRRLCTIRRCCCLMRTRCPRSGRPMHILRPIRRIRVGPITPAAPTATTTRVSTIPSPVCDTTLIQPYARQESVCHPLMTCYALCLFPSSSFYIFLLPPSSFASLDLVASKHLGFRSTLSSSSLQSFSLPYNCICIKRTIFTPISKGNFFQIFYQFFLHRFLFLSRCSTRCPSGHIRKEVPLPLTS